MRYIIRFHPHADPAKRYSVSRPHNIGRETLIGFYPVKSKALTAARLLAGWRGTVIDETTSARLA